MYITTAVKILYIAIIMLLQEFVADFACHCICLHSDINTYCKSVRIPTYMTWLPAIPCKAKVLLKYQLLKEC